ncbi:trifunctional serine/threonine-protein kinase/ATP-binding protein/sensor histidine kinase [Enhygromyxa salina]|uniref:histidine kinase n=1 Tax=Enhygromyxa salina TaxID=215803 RepID=A0A2S9YC36_9BACT|nr:ATP-binding sensor histidine kinase [Enhygromyxa salina]PRQ02674.1 Sensor protein ZraS [Enhygromyxa salina]
MLDLPAYEILESLHNEPATTLHRGTQRENKRRVLIKTLNDEYPTLRDIASLTREYELCKGLELPGVTKPLALQKHGNALALVLEDVDGVPVSALMSQAVLSHADAIHIAIGLARIIAQLHAHHVIHKNIQPCNVFYDRETKRVALVNFFIASQLSRESPRVNNPTQLEGNLHYISPEQTGRMNRAVDHRTDFYSLGVLLYQLLTDQLPFDAEDPMELVHAHIARAPESPGALDPALAGPISAVVMKLLAKTGEDRYQSGRGVEADLERCLVSLTETAPNADFLLASEDRFDRLELPQKLYGRSKELARLLDAFERVAAGGTEMVVVAGYSGIGKSSLVHEVHKPIVRRSGHFISGKFDQYKRNIPYDSIVQAFQEMVRQLLADSPEAIARWRQQLLLALGSNAKVIIDMIPQVELIAGPAPAVPMLDPIATQNRLDLALEQFIGVFADARHPLVLFLDDLQWADSASLRLIQRLLNDPDAHHLLLIGAYRDNEVGVEHPLALALGELDARDVSVERIELAALGQSDVGQFVADALHCERAHARSLADILYARSAGNPFFLGQLLEFLESDGALHFDHQRGDWDWNIERIKAVAVGDNVVDLMVAKLSLLPKRTQEVLELAACLGNRFELDVLSVVSESDTQEVANALWVALSEELILPLNDQYQVPMALAPELLTDGAREIGYKFLHDRVHQAAHALISASQRPQLHLKIGRLLARHAGTAGLEENIFEIVNNLNIAHDLIESSQERFELARLNLIAGRRARNSAAYSTARVYFNQGLALIGANCWELDASLSLDLHVDAIEAEYLNNDIERAATLSSVALEHTTDRLDEARVQRLRLKFLISRNDLHRAIEVALAILAKLGIHVEALADDPQALAHQFSEGLRAQGKRIADLPDFPDITDPQLLMGLEILTVMNAPAFLAAPALWPKVCFMMANLCVTHGNSFASGFIYVYIGNILCGMLDEVEDGYAIGRIAQDLSERYYAKPLRVQASIPYNLAIRHWKEPLTRTIAPYYDGIQDALAIGDLAFAGFHATDYCSIPLLSGDLPLDELLERQVKYIAMSRKLGQDWPVEYMLVWQQLVLNLLGQSADQLRMVGEAFDEDVSVANYEAQPSPTILFAYYLAKCWLAYMFDEHEAVLRHAAAALRHELGHQGFATVPVFYFYYGLALLSSAHSNEGETRDGLLERADVVIAKMGHWAEHGPDNYMHKHRLLLAEREGYFGDPLQAMDDYDRAIEGARVQGFLQEEALAHERAGDFYQRLDRDRIARIYLRSAVHCYSRWGARAKVAQLQAQFDALQLRRGESSSGGMSPQSRSTGELLDLNAVIRTSQALAGEIILERLLEKIMTTVITSAGAQRGFLLVERDARWEIQIGAEVDSGELRVQKGAELGGDGPGTLVSMAIVNYVTRTRSAVVLANAAREGRYIQDPYVIARQPTSVLCIPLLDRGRLCGLLYLENNLSTDVFTTDRVELLEMLSAQAAISIENARLYETLEDYSHNLEDKVSERTQKLEERNDELAVALETLEAAQARIIAQEKLASLGVLTSGIAHEIRNPLNFINNFAQLIIDIDEDLDEALEPVLNASATEVRDAVYKVRLDLKHSARAINQHGKRAQKILDDMHMLASHEQRKTQAIDVNLLVKDALVLAHHGAKAQDASLEVEALTEFDPALGPLEAVPADLNRALLNIMGNAFYAAHAHRHDRASGSPSQVVILTKGAAEHVEISVSDNGPGIPDEMLGKIFNPFFTTKPTDAGTGLGLSISHDIIVQLHGGSIDVLSEPGGPTRFVIRLPKRAPPVQPSQPPSR